MSIWKTKSVTEEPSIQLYKWRVFSVTDGIDETIHFVGWTGNEGRVSSNIVSYDKETNTGISRTGRVYKLVNNNGYDSDAIYTFDRWLSINGNLTYKDITEKY